MPKKILVTDDAMFMRVALKNILIPEGYAVFEASNGAEAVEVYEAHRPDLVIMDITMPVMDGITAIKKIRELDPKSKCIVCSAMGQKNMVLEAIQAGARDFVVKPFQPARVLDGVRQQIGH